MDRVGTAHHDLPCGNTADVGGQCPPYENRQAAS